VETVKKTFQLVDVDHSSEIDFSEFVTATACRIQLLKESKLKTAFDFFDKDKSGTIDLDEIKQVLGGGQNCSDKVWKEVVGEIDVNGDGEIDFEEFKLMMKNMLEH